MLGKSTFINMRLLSDRVIERALLYQSAVDRYAQVSRLTKYQLSSEDWAGIKTVATWLKMLSKATTLMSSSKETTISWAFVVLIGLQDNIRTQLRQLPANTPPHLRDGLAAAHNKFGEYIKIMDQSPFYMFAACESNFRSG
jgi:hypothetical protein